jgi:formylglycine-generating enzyme required for sulfatase activity
MNRVIDPRLFSAFRGMEEPLNSIINLLICYSKSDICFGKGRTRGIAMKRCYFACVTLAILFSVLATTAFAADRYNALDLLSFAQQWQEQEAQFTVEWDLDADGIVSDMDLLALIADWHGLAGIDGRWQGSGSGTEGQVDFVLFLSDGRLSGTIEEVGEGEEPEAITGDYSLNGLQVTINFSEGAPSNTAWSYTGTVNSTTSPSSIAGQIQGGPYGRENFSLTLLRAGAVPLGTIELDVTPDEGSWTLEGPANFPMFTGTGDHIGISAIANAPFGEYTLTCDDNVAGHRPPTVQAETLAAGETLIFNATWVLEASSGEEIIINIPGLPVDATPLVMVKIIPGGPGNFMMGCYPGDQTGHWDETPQHQVDIDYAFYIGKYELTKAQWQAVMGTTPWQGRDYVLDHQDSPAVYVSWDDIKDATGFLAKLNALGLGTFRLPSEAEWEYCCRATTSTRFYWGDDPDYTQCGDYAWYIHNAWYVDEKYAHVVGLKLPNAWGLYDMVGNVFEWCEDLYNITYQGAPIDGSAWVTGDASYRILRGGPLSLGPYRSAQRDKHPPDNRIFATGLRLLRTQ